MNFDYAILNIKKILSQVRLSCRGRATAKFRNFVASKGVVVVEMYFAFIVENSQFQFLEANLSCKIYTTKNVTTRNCKIMPFKDNKLKLGQELYHNSHKYTTN